jgi:hypothetical protein
MTVTPESPAATVDVDSALSRRSVLRRAARTAFVTPADTAVAVAALALAMGGGLQLYSP